jgi:hypothetical protein
MFPSRSQQLGLAAKLFFVFGAAVLLFGVAYLLLNQHSGQGLKASDGATVSYLQCVYFSVITITTVGYGDITPLGWSRVFASTEAIFGLTFAGYAISQVVSLKQEALVEYLTTDRITQTYDQCLERISEAREIIADRRRWIQNRAAVDPIDFIYNRSNPFYPALRAMQTLNGYTAHVEKIGKAKALNIRVERAAHHVEELASFVRKYATLLNLSKATWQTPRTKQILTQLCEAIDSFANSYIVHTRYATQKYKGGGLYKDIVLNLTKTVRSNL